MNQMIPGGGARSLRLALPQWVACAWRAHVHPMNSSLNRVKAIGLVVATFMLGFGVTVWMWRVASQQGYEVARQEFEFESKQARLSIQRRMAAYEQVLRGGVGLFAAIDSVGRNDWHAYVKALDVDTQYPGIQGVGFAQRILPDELAAHTLAIRSQGFPQYSVRPPGERSEYGVIVYLEPFDWRNQRAFGYDVFSEPVRHEAMVRARDTGKAAATGRITLVQETAQGVQHGFLMSLPVYKKNVPLGNVEQRRAALVGYVYAPFRMNNLMEGILGPRAIPYVRLRIADGEKEAAGNAMYDSEAPMNGISSAAAHMPVFDLAEPLVVGGRTWLLHFSSLPAFDATIDVQKPRLILGAGTLISMLIAAVVWSLLLSRQQAQALAGANCALREEIDERAKLEGALKEAKNAAEAANRAKSEFLANVSHELRTPLTLILAPLDELVAVEAPRADWHAQLLRMQRNALLLLNRVNDLLDFSKAEAGKFEVQWETVDLMELVTVLAEDAAEVARSKGCALTWRVDPQIERVCLDRRHAETILLNLVGNALKFTPAGGRIHVEAAAVDDSALQLSVSDTGIGIARDKLPLLFHRFQQVDATATRQFGGTGIGLALVADLVTLMKGTVEVASEVGQGSRFTVRLPRVSEEQAPDRRSDVQFSGTGGALMTTALRQARFAESCSLENTPVQQDGSCAVAEHHGKQMRVLVADDNADMRTYVADLLCAEWDVLRAADGQQAWTMLQSERIDIVVSDVMMPGLNGLELTQRIRASELLCHIPVILLTARGGSEALASALHTGADDYVAKPFSPNELKARLHAAARMSEIQKQLRETSREAGMAMLATHLLHNLGNVLNGLTVSSARIRDRLQHSQRDKLRKLADLLQEHADELPDFFARHPKASVVPAFLGELVRIFDDEYEALWADTQVIRASAEHAGQIIASQQQLARSKACLRELVSAIDMMEAAFTLGSAAFSMRDVNVERHYAYAGNVTTDRHKVLQILINLVSNAAHAIQEKDATERRIRLGTSLGDDCVRIEISDAGAGIDARVLPELFNQGFTTRQNGHGIGLHSSASWARELGGSLTCQSDGVGRGATFVLELPLPSADADGTGLTSTPVSEPENEAMARGQA